MVRQQPIRVAQQCRPHHMLRVLADNHLADCEAGGPGVLRASVALEGSKVRVFGKGFCDRRHAMIAPYRVAHPKVMLEGLYVLSSAID